MGFPIVGYYQLQFLHSSVGLTPRFTRYARVAGAPGMPIGAVVPQPDITEDGEGLYHFTITWNSENDPDISYEVDGGPSIPVEEVRYARGLATVRAYLALTGGGGGTVIASGGGGGNYTVGAESVGEEIDRRALVRPRDGVPRAPPLR